MTLSERYHSHPAYLLVGKIYQNSSECGAIEIAFGINNVMCAQMLAKSDKQKKRRIR